MLSIKDVRDYIAGLGIAEDDNCYCGKLPDKKDKSIGVYPLRVQGKPDTPIGGIKSKSYDVKGISLLLHWNRSVVETEETVKALYEKLRNCRKEKINEATIKYILFSTDKPVPVGTDSHGIYEYVIECFFYYERKGEQ